MPVFELPDEAATAALAARVATLARPGDVIAPKGELVLEHLEVYPTGGHSAFHVGDPNAPGRDWPDKYLPWLKTNQLTP